MEKKNSTKEANLSFLTSTSSTSSHGGKVIFHKESIKSVNPTDRIKKGISAISTTTTKKPKEKKIYLKPTKNTSTTHIKSTKISIESVDKTEKSEDNDKIKALEQELKNIKNKITSIDKTKEEKTLILKKTNEAIQSQTSLLTHQKEKMELLKEIGDRLTQKVNALKVEMDKLNEIRQEEPVPISLNSLLSRMMMNTETDSNKEEDSDDGNMIPNTNNYHGLSYEEIQELPVTLYDSSNEEKCVLCGFELCLNDFVIKLTKCHHVFHKECLVRFLSRRTYCPVCKQNVL